MKIPNFNPLRLIRLALAAGLLAERCNLLQERIAIQSAVITQQTTRNNLLEARNRDQMHTNLLQAQGHESLKAQLETNRRMLVATIRERDKFEAALDHACAELAQLKQERQEERRQIRTWVTRFMTMTPSRN